MEYTQLKAELAIAVGSCPSFLSPFLTASTGRGNEGRDLPDLWQVYQSVRTESSLRGDEILKIFSLRVMFLKPPLNLDETDNSGDHGMNTQQQCEKIPSHKFFSDEVSLSK